MKFTCDKEEYIIIDTISAEETYTMSKANHVNLSTGAVIPVGIKIFNMDQIPQSRRPSFDQEIAGAETSDHENIVKIHCKFVVENNRLWVITPPPRPSIRSVMEFSFKLGLPEYSVFVVLRQALEALHYMHDVLDEAHGNVGADYIFLNEEYSGVRLMQNIISYSTTRSKPLFGLPEYSVRMNDVGTKSGDVWNFGLLALELFYGRNILFGGDERFKTLLVGIKYEFEKIKRNWKRKELGGSGGCNIGRKILGCFNGGGKKMPPEPEPLMKVVEVKMPEKLMEVVSACLSDDPAKRPTTKQLLGFELFRENIPGKSSWAKIKAACKKEGRWLV